MSNENLAVQLLVSLMNQTQKINKLLERGNITDEELEGLTSEAKDALTDLRDTIKAAQE